MTARLLRLSSALLLAAPFAAPLSAQGVQYASGTKSYKISSTTKGTQTSPMGIGDFQVGLQEQVTVNLMSHAKDTVMATITVDSVALQSSGPAPDVKSLFGKKFVTLVSPTGKFYSTKAPEGIDPQLAQLAEGLGRFLPSYRSNLAEGLTWADTASGKVTQQGMEMDRTTVSNYKVVGDTSIGGQKAFQVQRMTSVKAAGSGSMQGSPISMETSGNSNGSFFISPNGIYLGGSSSDDVIIKITILAQNAEILIKQNAQTKIEAIR